MSDVIFKKGRGYLVNGKRLIFEQAVNFKEAILIDPESGLKITAPIIELRPDNMGSPKPASAERYTADELEEAERKFKIIEPLLSVRKDGSGLYLKIAAENKVSVPTLYRWRGKYIATGSIDGLVEKKRGVKKGEKRLDDDIEGIISAVLAKKHLSIQKTGPTALREDIVIEISTRGLSKKAPHINTIRNRIRSIDARTIKKFQEGPDAAEREFSENVAQLVADYPLEVVMVDHTMLKVVVVSDDEFRLPLGPAWITIVFDVYSRMVLGLYITLESPSAQSVGEAICHAVLPKEAWLKRLGIDDIEWPAWGKPTCLHADNGPDFRSETIRKSCIQHNINLHWRPVKKPNWGGHIEAYMKALYRMFKELPGALFKDKKERPNYDSTKEATMTLGEIEEYLVRRIIGKYHQERHSGIGGSTPLAKWQRGLFNPEKGLPLGLPPRVADEDTFRNDFRRRFERTIGPDGVQIDNVTYRDSLLSLLVNEREPGKPRLKKKFVFRRDDHNIKIIQFWDDKQRDYHPIAATNVTMPTASIWEWKKACDRVREEHGQVNETLVVKALIENRNLVAQSKSKTMRARREAERQKRTPSSNAKPHVLPPTEGGKQDETVDTKPFDDVESW